MRRLRIVPVVAVVLLAAAACGKDSDTGTTTPAGSSGGGGGFDCAGGSIKLGIAKAKTGDFAFFDKTGGQGSMVAVDKINEEGGIDGCKIEVTWEDTKSDPALAQQVGADLIRQGAQILIAPSDFDVGVGASLAAQKAKIFAFSPEASSEDWPTAAGPYFVVQGITTGDLGHGQAAFADKQGWASTYIVTNDAFNFFTEMEKAFTDTYGGEVLGREVVADDASDYSTVVSKIRDASPAPDFVYLNDYFPHVGTFIKQLRDAGVDTPVLGNSAYPSPDLAKVIGEDRMSQVYYGTQSYYEGSDVPPEVADFVDRYQAEFKTFPENVNAIAGYEGVLMLADALEKAGSTDAAAVTEAMESQKDFQLPSSVVYSWENGHTLRNVPVVGFDDQGNPQLVEEIDPRST